MKTQLTPWTARTTAFNTLLGWCAVIPIALEMGAPGAEVHADLLDWDLFHGIAGSHSLVVDPGLFARHWRHGEGGELHGRGAAAHAAGNRHRTADKHSIPHGHSSGTTARLREEQPSPVVRRGVENGRDLAVRQTEVSVTGPMRAARPVVTAAGFGGSCPGVFPRNGSQL